MESAWERPADFLRLSVDDLNALVAPFGLVVVEGELLAEGKANTNYRVRLSDGSAAVVRIHMRAPEAAGIESAAVERVAEAVPVARVRLQDLGRSVSVLDWLPGSTMERLLSESRFAEVVSAAPDLARAIVSISQVQFSAAGELNSELHVANPQPSAIEWLWGYLRYCLTQPTTAERLGEKLLEGVSQTADVSERRLGEAAGPPCLVHGDFKASNLLIHEGRLSGVLDWEFAHSGTWLFNLAQLFRHPLPPGFEAAFQEGIEEAGRSLPDDWRPLAAALDMVNLVEFASRESAGGRLLEDTRRLLAATVSMWGA